MVPFMESLLPAFLKLFPYMLPSAFQDKMKEEVYYIIIIFAYNLLSSVACSPSGMHSFMLIGQLGTKRNDVTLVIIGVT